MTKVASARDTPLAPLAALLRDEPAFINALGRRAITLSVPDPARALTIAGLVANSQRRPYLVVTPTGTDADRLAGDLAAYLGPDQVDLFPAWDTLPFERVSPGLEAMGRRMRTLWHLANPGPDAPAVVVAPIRAVLQRLGPSALDAQPVVIRKGDTVDETALVERLVGAGYRREYQVENRGELAVRGSIVDVFPATADGPVRIDLWGDEVDRLTEFTVADQRSSVDVDVVEIHPCREVLATEQVRARAAELVASEPWGVDQWDKLADGLTFDGMEAWLPWLAPDEVVLPDLLPADAQILLIEPRRLRDRAADVNGEEADLARALATAWGVAADEALPALHVPFDRLLARCDAPAWPVAAIAEGPGVAQVSALGWPAVLGDGEGLVRQIQQLMADGYRVVVGVDVAASAERMRTLLADKGFAFSVDPPDITKAGGSIVVAPIERGCILPNVKLAVLGESDLTGRRRAHRRAKPRKRDTSGFFDDLKPGDHVVHYHHGVARYGGMVKRAIGGVERDYLLLDYKGGDKLYVPSDQVDTVRHYTGGETPALNRLGGADFAKAKAKVRSAVYEIAQELVLLYQQRTHTPGYAYPPDTPWQQELEDAFPYTLTPDQAKAVADIKADMEGETPMDRLVCGDVGFGKTEVALRAAFKAIQDGKQVAVLVPTTLLAQQHFQTFSDRYAPFPVRVEVLSRFLTPAQVREVVAGVSSGEVDLVIGTHRLLSEDIRFKDLGLLVVDEEQRFGVSHKEQIKKIAANVDVLTLTATPIPRTLEMSLVGIRDLSLLQTPPADRQPILTYVGEYDDRGVSEAIRRELLREGQVFYVHNRVQSIETVAAHVRDLVPEARVAVAHGQLDEGSLEKVVIEFWEGAYDVLVCTTIIESGIDMPTVNTLVVDRADLLGLGQLHQIRGRVGRAGMRAYAYLFFPPDRVITEEAYERLKTIAEATELGSGFKIAMRDLEIRGAGNLLGTGQSGHVAAVGYDLYCQMVNEVVAELNGVKPVEPAEVKLEIPLDANLPPDYVGREDLRIEAYRRLAAVQTETEVTDIRAEWEDRYGPVPPVAEALLGVARLRAQCHRTGVREVTVTKSPAFSAGKFVARISPLHLKMSQAMRLQRLYKGSVYKEDLGQIQVPLPSAEKAADDLVTFLIAMVPPEPADGPLAGAPAAAGRIVSATGRDRPIGEVPK